MTFAPFPGICGQDREPAHRLWLELETRIATQRLHYRSGDEIAAAKSVASLFQTVRDLCAKHAEAKAFTWVALRLIDDTVRPYTARWHGWIEQKQFGSEQVRRTFRSELGELQQKLKVYQRVLAGLNPGATPDEADLKTLQDEHERSAGSRNARLGSAHLRSRINDEIQIAGEIATRDIEKAEHDEILHRRWIFDLGPKPKPGDPLLNACGLAFSGGGIRSATFCLGVTQELARRGFLPQFDYLSTVSGGGYFGSFLSCALGTETASTTQRSTEEAPPLAEDELHAEAKKKAVGKIEDAFLPEKRRPETRLESGLLRHLRNNSKYLLNGGLAARVERVGLIVSGILSNVLVFLPIPLLAALLVFCANLLGYWGSTMSSSLPNRFPIGTGAWWVLVFTAGILGLSWLFLPLVQRLTHGDAPGSKGAAFRRFCERYILRTAQVTVFAGLLFCLPAIFGAVATVQSGHDWMTRIPESITALSAAGTVLLGLLTRFLGEHRKRLRKLAATLFVLSGPIFFVSIFLIAGTFLGLGTPDGNPRVFCGLSADWLLAAITGGLFVWGWLFININTLSPHRFYRARLCECYLARRLPENETGLSWLKKKAGEWCQGRTAALRHLPLTKLGITWAAPYHLINTTVNLPGSKNKELRGRDGDFFLISKHYCGSPVIGYARTEEVEHSDPHFDLGTAMALSGAAASSNMGWKSLPHFRFLMTLFNIRLGYWLRWPPQRRRLAFWGVGPGPFYLFREITAKIHERCRYVNLSDGGHIENLAVYELLRRKCKFIVCVDAGMEPKMECADLMRLQRYAEIDLGIRLEVELGDLKLESNGFSRAYAVLVMIDYKPPLTEASARTRDWPRAEIGWMIYLKLALTGAEPGYVQDYRRGEPEFPHQSTGDQIYDEAQFEAYRRLGEVAMNSLFREELMGPTPPKEIRNWFQKLANNLLPDNHPCF